MGFDNLLSSAMCLAYLFINCKAIMLCFEGAFEDLGKSLPNRAGYDPCRNVSL